MIRLFATSSFSAPKRRTWPQLALLAGAYAAFAGLGELLAFSPAGVPPVAPATGLAVAALLVGGLRLWPGVLAGALSYHLVAGHDAALPYTSLAAGLALAAAVTGQAVVSAWLARPQRSGLARRHGTSLLKLVFLAGPVACTIAPSVRVLLSWQTGGLTPGSALSEWLLWWIADSAGVMLCGPLLMLALPQARRYWRGRWSHVGLPLLCAAIMTIVGVSFFHYAEKSGAHEPLKRKAQNAYHLALDEIREAASAVVATAHFVSTGASVGRDSFDAFAAKVSTPGVSLLAWLPREAVENGATGGTEPAADRFPVLYTDRELADTLPLVYELSPGSRYAGTLATARDTGEPAAGASLAPQAEQPARLPLFVPVYDGGVAGGSVEMRRENLRGFVLGVLEPRRLMEILRPTGEDGLAFRLEDVSVGGAREMAAQAAAAEAGAAELVWWMDVPLYERRWQLLGFSAPDVWRAGESLKARVFLLGILSTAFLFTLFVLAAAGRHRLISARVAAQTRELRDNRRKLRAAMAVSDIASFDFDVIAGELVLDDNYFALLRTTAAREGGHRMRIERWIREYLLAEDEPIMKDLIENRLGESFSVEFRLVRRDGKVRHMCSRFDSRRDAGGRVLRVFGTTQDITERKTTELALRRSEHYNRSIVDSSVDCLKVLSLDGRLLEMTPKGRELMQVEDFEQIRDAEWIGFWKRPEDREAVAAALETARNGGSSRFQGYTPTIGGAYRWWDVIVTPIPGADGRPARLLSVSRDITAERNAREEVRRLNTGLEQEIERRTRALRESERQLRATFNCAALGIAHIAPDGTILRVNPRFCEIAACREEDLIGQPLKLTHPEDRELDDELIARLLRNEIPMCEVEKRYVREDGSTVWVRVTNSVVHDEDGKVVYRLSMVDDISQSRADRESRIASELRYRELFDRNPMPMWTYDPITLRFTSANEAATVRYGYSREEFLSMTLRDIRPEREIAALERQVKRRNEGYQGANEAQHRRKDGTLLTAEIIAHDVGSPGRFGRLVLAHDITERKRAAALLEGNRMLLERIASGAPLDETLAAICGTIESNTQGMVSTILSRDSESGRLHFSTSGNVSGELLAGLRMLAGSDWDLPAAAAEVAEPLLMSDVATDPACPEPFRDLLLEHGFSALWSAPVEDAAGAVMGAVVSFLNASRLPSAVEKELVEALTQTAAVAISRDRETAELRRSEERFRTTFEFAALGIAHIDAGGRFLKANQRLCEIMGYDAEALLSVGPDDVQHPDDRENSIDHMRRLWNGEFPNYSAERRCIRRDGTPIWVHVTISAVRDKEGKTEYAVGLFEDISWRKRAEAELHQQQELNRLLLENLAEGVVACDANGKLIMFNKTARDWHGTDPREIPPEEWSDHYGLFESDGRTALALERIPLIRAVRGERVNNAEMSIVRKDCEARNLLASGGPLLDATGAKVGAVVVMHDVSERRRYMIDLEKAAKDLRTANAAVEHERAMLAERVAARTTELTIANAELGRAKEAAESASRAKSIFLAAMSHEIRTPINGIVGMIDVLRHVEMPPDQRDMVETIRTSSFSLLHIIDNVLDFSKIEAGRMILERSAVHVSDVVENVCDGLATGAVSNGIDLELFIDPEVPPLILADPTRLRQVLYNLVGNAIKFSGRDDGRRGNVAITVETADGDPRRLSFRIADNGIGIEPEVLPSLFKSFSQGEASTTRRFGGSGLGLAICKRLVELMRGTITVESTPGAGSAFTVSLPLVPAGNAPVPALPDIAGAHCILLAEADPKGHIGAYLSHAGARWERAESLAAAVTVAGTRGDPTVVIRKGDGTASDSRRDTGAKLRHLIITPGFRRRARVVADDLVELGGNPLHRQDFLHAVAVCAGRASPLDAPDALPPQFASVPPLPTIEQARAENRLILVAEDDTINQKVIMRQLALLGYRGDLAAHGADALKKWQTGSYAMLLTDMHMPEMDGYTLTAEIRRQEDPSRRMPVLALTANALRGEAEKAHTLGIDEYLTKPLQLTVLRAALEKWLTRPADRTPEPAPEVPLPRPEREELFDPDLLTDIIGNDTGIFCEFLVEYLVSSRQIMTAVRDALARSDAGEIGTLVHRHKGASRAIGARGLAELCAEMGEAARNTNLRKLERLAPRFNTLSESVLDEIEGLLSRKHGERPAVEAS